MNEMLGSKPVENKSVTRTDATAWPWVNSSYTLKIGKPVAAIATLEIDPSQRMADVNKKNNKWSVGEKAAEYKNPTR